MLKVTTHSGAVYIISDAGKVTGGSKDLKNGVLVSGPPVVGDTLLMQTPERIPLRELPPPSDPAVAHVRSSTIISIEPK
ncbi:hypothetical protein LCGC14_1590690 [marine sediment metagenome]|uniref:Uncharacterized protein n=1 Tax=marine sediment metagenome TaxID=412755 RepID=A0A0F9LEI5_9ZZZZ